MMQHGGWKLLEGKETQKEIYELMPFCGFARGPLEQEELRNHSDYFRNNILIYFRNSPNYFRNVPSYFRNE